MEIQRVLVQFLSFCVKRSYDCISEWVMMNAVPVSIKIRATQASFYRRNFRELFHFAQKFLRFGTHREVKISAVRLQNT